MAKQFIWIIFFIFCSTLLFAHKEDVPNNNIISWEKLEIIVSFDEEGKALRIKGHSHHMDGTKILVTLKFAPERYSLESRYVIVKDKAFECIFGPFEDKNLISGDYEISCWFIMDEQSKATQKSLLKSNFFHCVPPCRFDFQHYQTEIVSIGTEKEIEEQLQNSQKYMKAAYQKINSRARKVLDAFKQKQKELEGNFTKEELEKRLEKFFYDIDDLHYEIREVEQELMEYREEKAYIYFLGVYDRLLSVASFTEILKNAVKRSWNKKNTETLKKMDSFCENLEKELDALPDLIKNNIIEDIEDE